MDPHCFERQDNAKGVHRYARWLVDERRVQFAVVFDDYGDRSSSTHRKVGGQTDQWAGLSFLTGRLRLMKSFDIETILSDLSVQH